MYKTIEELGEELCKYCSCTDYGLTEVNTGYWNLCEGCACDKAYENYLETIKNEKEQVDGKINRKNL